jgi:hypothetical protein
MHTLLFFVQCTPDLENVMDPGFLLSRRIEASEGLGQNLLDYYAYHEFVENIWVTNSGRRNSSFILVS